MPEAFAGILLRPPAKDQLYHRMFPAAGVERVRAVGTIVLGLLLFTVGASLVALAVMGVVWIILGQPGTFVTFSASIRDFTTPWGMAAAQVGLASLIPIAMVCSVLGNQAAPRWLWSVTGRVRWGIVAWAAGIALVTIVGPGLISRVDQSWDVRPQDNFWWFLLAVALTSPLQAAAEEVFFRGYLQQALGTLAANQWVSVVGSAAIFALYHGAQNWPLFMARFAFGLLAGWLVIRTGGLEAGIAAHVVNNIAAFVLAGLFGTISGARTTTAIGWIEFAWMTGGYALFAGCAALVALKQGSQTRTAGSV